MKKYLKRIKTLFAFNREERQCYRQALVLLIELRIRMSLSTFSRVLQWVRKQTPDVRDKKKLSAERLAWMIESTGMAFPNLLKCLPRALAGFMLLRKCGWSVTLKIGARRFDSSRSFEAHAWLEREGRILLGELPDIDKYAVFDTFEGNFL